MTDKSNDLHKMTGQLHAMLAAMSGGCFEAFEDLPSETKEWYIYACCDLARELKGLVWGNSTSCGSRKAKP